MLGSLYGGEKVRKTVTSPRWIHQRISLQNVEKGVRRYGEVYSMILAHVDARHYFDYHQLHPLLFVLIVRVLGVLYVCGHKVII